MELGLEILPHFHLPLPCRALRQEPESQPIMFPCPGQLRPQPKWAAPAGSQGKEWCGWMMQRHLPKRSLSCFRPAAQFGYQKNRWRCTYAMPWKPG